MATIVISEMMDGAAVDTLRDFLSGQAKILIVDLPFVLLFLGLVAFMGGWLVLVPMAALGLLAVAALLVGRRLKLALQSRATLDDRRYSFIIEVLTGINTVKGLAMEAQMQRRYDRLQESSAASTYNVRVGRSDTIIGPYVDRSGVAMVDGGGTLMVEGDGVNYAAAGHSEVIVANEMIYHFYHAYRQDNGNSVLRIAEMPFDDEGWPVPGGP